MDPEHRLIEDRKRKLTELRELGVEPYPHLFKPSHAAAAVAKRGLAPGQETDDSVTVAGRILLLRRMGKASFFHLQDESGKIQVCVQQDAVGEKTYEWFKRIDLGDIIGVEGTVFATKTGETTVKAKRLTLLCKALRPLPEKYHGLQDMEKRYRQRYLDLTMNTEVRETFRKRSLLLKAVREFMESRGFMEVETPLLQTQYGGANARPFVTHINAWDMPMFLSISPELYLKRLIVGGYEKVYTICKNFRNEGVDQTHNPEFTMLEAYQAYADYNDMMALIEQCYEFVAKKVNGTTKVKRKFKGKDGTEREVEIDFKAPWPRVTLADAIKQHVGIDVLTMDAAALRKELERRKIPWDGDLSWGGAVQLLFDELVEKEYIQPTHLIDRPRESTPLCKVHRKDGRLIEQNEPVAAGMELGNMYSELNDPIVQRELLEDQAQKLRAGSDEAHPMDEDFIQAIEHGMPPTGGIGWGIDRMAVLLLGVDGIRDVLLFPTMRPEENR